MRTCKNVARAPASSWFIWERSPSMTPASWLATEFMFLCSLACDALSPVGCCTDGLCEVELAFFGMAAALSLCAPVCRLSKPRSG